MLDVTTQEVPATIANLARAAKACGWTYRLTYAEGDLPMRGGERAINSVCLRLARPGERCWATWEVTAGCRFFAAQHNRRGKMNLTEFRNYVLA